MKIKYYTLIFMLSPILLFGQLEMNIIYKNAVAEITIYNNSDEKYVLPLDKYHLRPYEKDCDAFYDYESNYPNYGLMTNIFDSSGKNVDYIITYKQFDNIKELEHKVAVKIIS